MTTTVIMNAILYCPSDFNHNSTVLKNFCCDSLEFLLVSHLAPDHPVLVVSQAHVVSPSLAQVPPFMQGALLAAFLQETAKTHIDEIVD